MKRHCMMFACILLLTIATSPITAAQGMFSVGALGGVNIADASISASGTSLTTSSRSVLVAGALLERKLSDIFFVQVELVYIQKGPEWKLASSTVTARLSYLEVPVLLKAKFGTAAVKPVLLAGIATASLMTSEQEVKTGTVTRTVDMKNATQPFEISILGGGGVEIMVSETISVFANGRYSLGLLDVDKGGANWTSRGIQVVGGLMFGL